MCIDICRHAMVFFFKLQLVKVRSYPFLDEQIIGRLTAAVRPWPKVLGIKNFHSWKVDTSTIPLRIQRGFLKCWSQLSSY